MVAVVQSDARPDDLNKLLSNLERFLFIRMIQMSYLDDELDLLESAVQIVRGELSIPSFTEKIGALSQKRAEKLDISSATVRWARERSYYGWTGLKYFLFEYEQHLKAKSRSSRDKLIWEDFTREDFEKDYGTIEHIYPQKPKDPYWSSHFGKLATRERNAVRNSLGNLLALSRPKNSALGNMPFPKKRDGDLVGGGYRVGSYSEIEVAEQKDWTPSSVLERGVRLLDFMETRWGIRLGTRAQKIASLRLSFLEGGPGSEEGEDDDEGDAGEAS